VLKTSIKIGTKNVLEQIDRGERNHINPILT